MSSFVPVCFFKKHTKHFLSIIYINTCFQTHNLAFLSWLKIPPWLAKKYPHIVNQITKYVRDQLNNFLTFYFVLPLVTLLKFLLFLFKSCTSASERFAANIFSGTSMPTRSKV